MQQVRSEKILQAGRTSLHLFFLLPRKLSKIQVQQCQSINSTFYPTTTPHRSMQPYPRQNMTRSSESSTSVKRNASASPSSINETNNFSTPKFNASSDTSGSLRMPNINPKTIPTVMMVLQFLAAVPYAIEGNARMTVYWIAAGILTLALTWL